jgi:hypothetical protein
MTAPLLERIVSGGVTVLKRLKFDGLRGGVSREGDIDAVNLELPCIIVSLHGEAEKMLGGTTHTRFRGYGFRVMLLANDEVSLQDEAKIVGWRGQILDAFDRRRRQSEDDNLKLPNCPEVYQVTVNPRPVLDENLKQYKYAVSGLVVEVEAAVAR